MNHILFLHIIYSLIQADVNVHLMDYLQQLIQIFIYFIKVSCYIIYLTIKLKYYFLITNLLIFIFLTFIIWGNILFHFLFIYVIHNFIIYFLILLILIFLVIMISFINLFTQKAFSIILKFLLRLTQKYQLVFNFIHFYQLYFLLSIIMIIVMISVEKLKDIQVIIIISIQFHY